MSIFLASMLASNVVFGMLSFVALIARNFGSSAIRCQTCTVVRNTVVPAICLTLAAFWIFYACHSGGMEAFDGVVIGAVCVAGSLFLRSRVLR